MKGTVHTRHYSLRINCCTLHIVHYKLRLTVTHYTLQIDSYTLFISLYTLHFEELRITYYRVKLLHITHCTRHVLASPPRFYSQKCLVTFSGFPLKKLNIALSPPAFLANKFYRL